MGDRAKVDSFISAMRDKVAGVSEAERNRLIDANIAHMRNCHRDIVKWANSASDAPYPHNGLDEWGVSHIIVSLEAMRVREAA